jgi:hypothetical protein
LHSPVRHGAAGLNFESAETQLIDLKHKLWLVNETPHQPFQRPAKWHEKGAIAADG